MQAELLGEAADPAPGCLTAPRVVVLRRSGDLADVVLGGVGAESSDIEHERLLSRGGSTQIRGSATTDRDTRDPHRRYRCAITASLCASSGARARRAAGRVTIGQGPAGCEVVQAGEQAAWKSVGSGRRVYVRVDLGGRRVINIQI